MRLASDRAETHIWKAPLSPLAYEPFRLRLGFECCGKADSFHGEIHIIQGKNVKSDASLATGTTLELKRHNKGLALIFSKKVHSIIHFSSSKPQFRA